MTIDAYRSLSDKAKEEILDLESSCIEHDNLRGSFFLDPSLNFEPQINSFFLYYQKGQLISMLSMFIPTKHEAEITAYTLPACRGKGYFKSLLGKAVEELTKFDIPELLFVCESNSTLGKQVIKALKADYKHTEYFMRLDKSRYSCLKSYRLKLLKAEQKDFERAITANMSVFGDSYEESKSLIKNCFESDTRVHYLAVLNEEIIGVASANLEGEDVSIFGLGVVPDYHGKGYGKELLHLMVDRFLKRGRSEITIEVHSENESALALYKTTGFRIEVAYEYYGAKVNQVL
ncbi:GNAT family N-acetyltransferase [Desulfosporosinus youngiae]|uniref:Acetyltransferase n=1 Tax=Desulfosporosinus youngiae DSM 17734 TaxID=768710 RepID=H5XSU0_9FIRM|nr:GNAT family N-acetyltransferase [Desulfosporosinus youngiae]EHQ87903.1 acetyltransferase [Desulfosporosinus youngiae DSM 17734]